MTRIGSTLDDDRRPTRTPVVVEAPARVNTPGEDCP
jgi:hypothetical protein